MLKIGGGEGQITQEEPKEELQEELQKGELSRNLKSHTETQAGGSFIGKSGGDGWIGLEEFQDQKTRRNSKRVRQESCRKKNAILGSEGFRPSRDCSQYVLKDFGLRRL
jgi:hypothetical protein